MSNQINNYEQHWSTSQYQYLNILNFCTRKGIILSFFCWFNHFSRVRDNVREQFVFSFQLEYLRSKVETIAEHKLKQYLLLNAFSTHMDCNTLDLPLNTLKDSTKSSIRIEKRKLLECFFSIKKYWLVKFSAHNLILELFIVGVAPPNCTSLPTIASIQMRILDAQR